MANDILVELESEKHSLFFHLQSSGEPYSKQTKTQMNSQLLKCNEGKEPSTNMKIIIPERQGVLGYRGVLNDFSEEASHLELKEEEELGRKVERRTWVQVLGQELGSRGTERAVATAREMLMRTEHPRTC